MVLATVVECAGEGARYPYGSHYSCPGCILYYLVRRDSQLMLCLQNGRFDHPNSLHRPGGMLQLANQISRNLFVSFTIQKREENIYFNSMKIDFGVRHTGERVGDVALPSLAKNNKYMVDKLRLALENPTVSRSLHCTCGLIRFLGARLAGRGLNLLCYD